MIRSEQELRGLQAQIALVRDEYPIAMTVCDLNAGVVVVGLSRDDPAARRAIEERFGSAVRVDDGTWHGYAV